MKNTKLSKTQSTQTYAQFYTYVHSKASRPRSREVSLRWVERIGEHYQPDGPGLRRLSERQALDYLIYLRDDKKLAASILQQVGRGKKAIPYLAAHVGKSAFSEDRLLGYDTQGRIRMSWRDLRDGETKIITLTPCEFIRRWLQHWTS